MPWRIRSSTTASTQVCVSNRPGQIKDSATAQCLSATAKVPGRVIRCHNCGAPDALLEKQQCNTWKASECAAKVQAECSQCGPTMEHHSEDECVPAGAGWLHRADARTSCAAPTAGSRCKEPTTTRHTTFPSRAQYRAQSSVPEAGSPPRTCNKPSMAVEKSAASQYNFTRQEGAAPGFLGLAPFSRGNALPHSVPSQRLSGSRSPSSDSRDSIAVEVGHPCQSKPPCLPPSQASIPRSHAFLPPREWSVDVAHP